MGYTGTFKTKKEAIVSSLADNINSDNYLFVVPVETKSVLDYSPWFVLEDKETKKRTLIYVQTERTHEGWLYKFMSHSVGPYFSSSYYGTDKIPKALWGAFLENPEGEDRGCFQEFKKRVYLEQPELKGI